MDGHSNETADGLSGLAAAAIVVGYSRDPAGWIDLDRLVPIAGGGVGGRRAAQQAVDILSARHLIEAETLAGRAIYRRSVKGIELADELLAEGNRAMATLSEEPGFESWSGDPFAPRSLEDVVGQAAAKEMVNTN